LLFEAALAAATGISRIEFHCDDRTRDTIAAAARGAELMMQRDLFYKAS
jgi:hypothetical protein